MRSGHRHVCSTAIVQVQPCSGGWNNSKLKHDHCGIQRSLILVFLSQNKRFYWIGCSACMFLASPDLQIQGRHGTSGPWLWLNANIKHEWSWLASRGSVSSSDSSAFLVTDPCWCWCKATEAFSIIFGPTSHKNPLFKQFQECIEECILNRRSNWWILQGVIFPGKDT